MILWNCLFYNFLPDCMRLYLFLCQASSASELSLRKGERIVATHDRGDGWLFGDCGGRKGFFPLSSVSEVEAKIKKIAAYATPARALGMGAEVLPTSGSAQRWLTGAGAKYAASISEADTSSSIGLSTKQSTLRF